MLVENWSWTEGIVEFMRDGLFNCACLGQIL